MTNPFFTADELRHLATVAKQEQEAQHYGINWFQQQARPVYLFGCGGFAYGIQEALVKLDLRGYLDNDPAKQGMIMHGLSVSSPEEAAKRIRAESGLIVISMFRQRHADEAAAQCAVLGLDCLDWRLCWPAFERLSPPTELAENADVIRCFGLWREEESRQVFRDLIRFRSTLNAADAPSVTEPQYFIQEISHHAHRNFVDAGAYDGDTLRTFLTRYGDDFQNYHAFEPVENQWRRLVHTAHGDPRIHIHRAGLSERPGKARITDRDTSSQVGKDGDTEIALASLDTALGDAPVSFIKMDIEGEEPAALRGAEGIIRRDHPVLAISVYHQPDHLWRVPEWIAGLELGYRLLLRHHSRFITETVCYALPE